MGEAKRKREGIGPQQEFMVIEDNPGRENPDTGEWEADPDKWNPILGLDLPLWVKDPQVMGKIRNGLCVCNSINAKSRWYRGFPVERPGEMPRERHIQGASDQPQIVLPGGH